MSETAKDQKGSKIIEKDSGRRLKVKDMLIATSSPDFRCFQTEIPSEGAKNVSLNLESHRQSHDLVKLI